jgi:catechol 2,3-dioxygenase-like lactoylglutathione lyase family enzyme
MVKAKASNQQDKSNHPVKDPFLFKYLRFQCNDLKRTIDFYTSLGMSIDWQVKQPDKKMTPEEMQLFLQQQQQQQQAEAAALGEKGADKKNGSNGAKKATDGNTPAQQGQHQQQQGQKNVGFGMPGIQSNKQGSNVNNPHATNTNDSKNGTENSGKENFGGGGGGGDEANEPLMRSFVSFSFKGQNLEAPEPNVVSLIFEHLHVPVSE